MTKPAMIDVTEQKRLNEAREAGIPWKKWGPYLSERQWGTVREDYSDNGDAWNYFTHDQARSRSRYPKLMELIALFRQRHPELISHVAPTDAGFSGYKDRRLLSILTKK